MRLRRILVLAKDLQKSLENANISVDESTIRTTLNKNGVYGRTPEEATAVQKKTLFHSTTGKI
jgi:hypothetical protein